MISEVLVAKMNRGAAITVDPSIGKCGA